jgi:hypothetical protein
MFQKERRESQAKQKQPLVVPSANAVSKEPSVIPPIVPPPQVAPIQPKYVSLLTYLIVLVMRINYLRF